jgi:hypothetical protein
LTTKIIHKRCSRPLCSSQATTGHQHPHPSAYPHHPRTSADHASGSSERYQPAATRAPPPPAGKNKTRSDPERTTFRLFPQDPTACPANPSPAANRSHPEPRRAWRTRSPPARKPAIVDVPPSSTVPHSFGRDNGPGHHQPPHDRTT